MPPLVFAPSSDSNRKSRLPLLRLRTWIVLRTWEMWAYLRLVLSPNGGTEGPRILIFGQGRSGTTLFEDLMCSTGYMQGYGEVLHHHTREVLFPARFIMGLARIQRDRGIIVHVKGSQLTSTRIRPISRRWFLEQMVADGWTIVHVVRESTYDQVASEFIAKTRGGYHKIDDSPETTRIAVAPERFLTYFRNVEDYKRQDEEAIAGIPHLRVVYEKELADQTAHQATVDRVLDLLGLPHQPVQARLKRIGGTRQRLSNADEIVATLREVGCLDCAQRS